MRQRGLENRRSRSAVRVFVCVLALSLTSCEDDQAPQVERVAGDVDVEINSQTVRAIENVTFTFPNAGQVLTPALANQTFSVTLTNTATATPTATFAVPAVTGSDGQPGRFTATTEFGSCRFRVTSSNMAGVVVGQVITVNPCQVRVSTNGITVQTTGAATRVQILLQLGLTPSAPQQANVSIEPGTGVVTINDVNTGATVTLNPVT